MNLTQNMLSEEEFEEKSIEINTTMAMDIANDEAVIDILEEDKKNTTLTIDIDILEEDEKTTTNKAFNYVCKICSYSSTQISHHQKHISTEKHKLQMELFRNKLEKLTEIDLEKEYKNTNIDEILKEYETISNIEKKKKKKFLIKDEQINLSDSIDIMNSISNRETLRDKIHEIHNFLRNNGAGYGMNALKIFNLLYGLKKIEDNQLFNKLGLSDCCKFSNLLELANNHNDEELCEYINNDVLDAINDCELVKDFLFYEIPKRVRSNVYSYLIKEIDTIGNIENTCNIQLSGKIYEYFIGRDESAISELGAYFTDRHIINYIYDLLKPQLNNTNGVDTMIDPFGGSGGFTTGYINYLIENNPDIDINWETDINNVYHIDMNEDVVKSAALEFLCLTKNQPNMKENMICENSFKYSFGNKKYKYVVTNPPYGGDKNKKTDKQIKRNKVIEYIKKEIENVSDETIQQHRKHQLKILEIENKNEQIEKEKSKVSVDKCSDRIIQYAKNNKLKGNDKEGASLILMMDLLEEGGTATGVLKEGVFFNKTYKNLRECLINNFNVRKVISVPKDQFENTSTKTSIIIFDNTEEKTSKIEFYNLIVDRYTEDKFIEENNRIILTENKCDIKDVYDEYISTATKNELLKHKDISFNGKDYKKQEIIPGDGYELVRLGDICEFKPKSKRGASYGCNNGYYNFYTSSDKIKKCDEADYNEECLIIGDGGTANIHIDINFSCSDHNHIISTKNNKYIYYILKAHIHLLENGFSGSVLKNLSKIYLTNLKIPLPNTQDKIQEWVDKISKPYNDKNNKTNQLEELEKEVADRVKYICENEECDEVELGSICDIEYGKRITKNKNKGTKYIAYGGGDIMSYKVDNYNREGVTYKISRDGLSLHNCVVRIYGKIFLNDTALSLSSNNKIIDICIGEQLLQKKEYIYNNCSHGSAQLHIDTIKLLKLKIQIPKNKQLIQDLEPKFQEIEKLQEEIKVAEELYRQYIDELGKEAIKG